MTDSEMRRDWRERGFPIKHYEAGGEVEWRHIAKESELVVEEGN